MENIFLRYQEFYQGVDIHNRKPFNKFDTALEHKSNSSKLMWGQFIKTSSNYDFFTHDNIEKINKKPGYAFFSDGKKIYYGKIIEVLNAGDLKVLNHQKEIPFYYRHLANSYNPVYKFKVGLWVRLEFFRELNEKICDHIVTKNGKNIENLFKSQTTRAFVYFKENFFDNMIVNFEKNQMLYNHEVVPMDESNYVYGKKFDNGIDLSISLTNPLMIKRDYEYLFNEEQAKEDRDDYRPYLYEVLINENYRQKLSEMMEEGIYYRIKFVEKKEESHFVGTVVYSASMIETFEDVEIEIVEKLKTNLADFKKLKEIEKRLEKILTITTDKKIFSDFLKAQLPTVNQNKVSNIDVNIFNVGQANWISIDIKGMYGDTNTIVYDCGHSRNHKEEKKLNSNFSKAVAEASIVETDMYILSHWDEDHINGVLKIATNSLKKPWVIPELETSKMTFLAKRLLAFIIINSNYCCISRQFGGSIVFSNDFFKIGKGHGKGGEIEKRNSHKNKYGYKSLYTYENNLGLILEFIANDNNILLTGDCEYIQFPKEFLNEYQYIVLPHHGAEVKEVCLPRNISYKNPTGYFCAGEFNKSGTLYPNIYHENIIKYVKGYATLSTKDFKSFNEKIVL